VGSSLCTFRSLEFATLFQLTSSRRLPRAASILQFFVMSGQFFILQYGFGDPLTWRFPSPLPGKKTNKKNKKKTKKKKKYLK